MTKRTAILIAATSVALFLLASCFQTERQGRTVRHWSERGDRGGIPFSTSGEETTESQETQKTGVDPQAIADAVGTAMRAATTAGTGGLSALLPQLAGAATTVIAGGFALAKHREAKASQAEADAAWDAEREASIKAAAAK